MHDLGSNDDMNADRTVPTETAGAAAGTVRVLTLNLGLLGLELRNRWHVALAGENEERLAAAPQMLCSVGADVLALQEVYSPAHARMLVEALATRYPFSAAAPRSRSIIGSGLMFFSRFPIVRSAFTPCRGAPWWTAPLWQQGFLAVDVDLPVIGCTRLINVHVAASLPFGNPHSNASEANRRSEIAQLIAAASAEDRAAILVGDFNTSEEIYPENYDRIIEAGYADAFISANKSAPTIGAVTWDSTNPLNTRGRFRDHPSQRIDHVFVHNAHARSLAPIAAQVVLQDRNIRLKSGEYSSLSDHYGMLVTLRCGRSI
jgi:endonuclease/exonuclease/phosphatase family metal-dependent hydrolase